MNTAPYLEQVQEVLKDLARETDEVKKSDFFKQYLETMSRFWSYSFRNQMLIHLAKPTAKRVAGFATWKKLGRFVKKGQKAIKIVAPFTGVRENEEGEQEPFTYFVPVNVFDVSQTDGEELAQIEVDLTGEDQVGLLEKLIDFCQARDIKLDFQELGVNGLYGYATGGAIKIASNGSVNTRVNTLVHEITHELLHFSDEGKKLSKAQQEIQAEGTAYVVCRHFGMDVKSFNYLALYDADYTKIMGNLDAIARASKEILEFLCFISCSNSAPLYNRKPYQITPVLCEV